MATKANKTLTLKNVELGYVKLVDPTPKLNGQGMEYSCQVILDKDHPQLDDLKAVIKAQKEQVFPDIPFAKLKICLRDNDAEGNAEKYDNLKNTMFFNARRQEKKGQVPCYGRYDTKTTINPVTDAILFSGCLCNVVVNIYTYTFRSDGGLASNGISSSIEAVQIVDNVNVTRRDGQVETSGMFETLDADESIDNFGPAAEVVELKPKQPEQAKPAPAAAVSDSDLPW